LHAHHHSHDTSDKSDKNLIIAVGVNVILTVVQIIGGLISGSLSLIADALHNFSDAASLGIALFARKIARRPPDAFKTFGYKRAEIIAALINLTTLILIGIYLVYEALWRLAEPVEIAGWIVIVIAAIALLVDLITAALTYAMSKNSLNIRAAFLHNVADALSSIGVIIAGTCILLFNWLWIDALITLVIAGYILYQGFTELPKTIHILMDGTPEHLSVTDVIASLEKIDGISNVHHVHIRQLDEHSNAMEAHIVTDRTIEGNEHIKTIIRSELRDKFRIEHSTLEFEHPNGACCEPVHDNH
jgi:cobalt-zinc-cadmium efflux system protein